MMKLLKWLGGVGAWLRSVGRALTITEPSRLRAPPFHVVLQTGHQRLPRRIPQPKSFLSLAADASRQSAIASRKIN